VIPALLLACSTFFTMPHVQASPGESVVMQVIGGPTGGVGLDVDIFYDPSVAKVTGVELGNAAPGTCPPGNPFCYPWVMFWNVVEPGHLDVAMFSIYPLKLDGEVLLLEVETLGDTGDSTLFDLNVMVDEDTVESCETNGSIRVTR